MVDVGPGEQTLIGYDKASKSLYIDRSQSGQIPAVVFAAHHSAPLAPRDGLITLHVFVDRSSVEVLANDGERVMASC
jgi:fructan beta-fructosidase